MQQDSGNVIVVVVGSSNISSYQGSDHVEMVSGNSLAFTVGGKHAFDVSIPDVAQTQMQGKNEVVLEFHVDDTTGANEVGCQSRVFIKLFCIFAEQHCLTEVYGPWQALMLRNFSV